VEVETRSGTPHNRRIAIGLSITLVGSAVLAYALAALLDFTLSGGQSLDPHRHGFATAGALAAALCILALWRLREVARGRTGWGDAGLSFGFAILALLVLVVVAFASRLGG
jgi:predicted Co/Zn/Cd cation transporter (cation efflux family)